MINYSITYSGMLLRNTIIVLALFVGLSKNIEAQLPTILLLSSDSVYKEKDGLLLLSADGAIGSNVLDNSFLKKSFFGGHIESDHIARLKGNMKDQNRAGFMLSAGLEARNYRDTLFRNPDWGLSIGFSTNYHASMSFSKDLFSLVYQGNQQFRNDTAEFGPLFFQYQAWQKIGLGIFNKRTMSSAMISLVEGQTYHSLLANNAGLYTSTTGDSLALSYSGDYWRSDTSKTGWANGSGIGAAVDFEYNLPMMDHHGMISVAVHDLGFVVWNKYAQHFSFDSLSIWQGVDVNDVISLADDTLNLPSLRDTLNYNVTKKYFIAPLPLSVHLRYCRFFGRGNFYEMGLSMWPNRASVPRVYAGVTHFIGQDFALSEKLSYGGYGRFGLGAEMQWMPCGTWLFRAGTNNIGGFVSGSVYGRDIYFAIGKTF